MCKKQIESSNTSHPLGGSPTGLDRGDAPRGVTRLERVRGTGCISNSVAKGLGMLRPAGRRAAGAANGAVPAHRNEATWRRCTPRRPLRRPRFDYQEWRGRTRARGREAAIAGPAGRARARLGVGGCRGTWLRDRSSCEPSERRPARTPARRPAVRAWRRRRPAPDESVDVRCWCGAAPHPDPPESPSGCGRRELLEFANLSHASTGRAAGRRRGPGSPRGGGPSPS